MKQYQKFGIIGEGKVINLEYENLEKFNLNLISNLVVCYGGGV